MAKRGPKSWHDSGRIGLPVIEIAARLGVSPRTVSNDLKRAEAKLRRNPKAFSILLEWIHAVDSETVPLIGCGSVECDQEFVRLYAEVR